MSNNRLGERNRVHRGATSFQSEMIMQKLATETTDQTMRRLAFQALNRALRILEYPAEKLCFCTSFSEPDRLHLLTETYCDCLGFSYRGYCQHYALYLHHTGQLPPPVSRRSDWQTFEPIAA